MALPSSGPLALTDIQTEFGGSNPASLSEYYAGGGYVPPGTTGTNGAVPSSGTLSIWNFYGTQSVIPRAVLGGGYRALCSGCDEWLSSIEYWNPTTLGNAAYFGQLTTTRTGPTAFSNSTRGCFSGGSLSTTVYSVIDYVTFATTGNAGAFGSLTVARRNPLCFASTTRAGTAGGYTGSAYSTVIDYVTTATTGNATSFGALTVAREGGASTSSPTRGVFMGGSAGYRADKNTIDYITTATTGNATSFGVCTLSAAAVHGGSSSTRGVFTQGSSIQYITIATAGNSAAFGSQTYTATSNYGTSSQTLAFYCGGFVLGGGYPGSYLDGIYYITISTLGNTVSFGSLTARRSSQAATSNVGGWL